MEYARYTANAQANILFKYKTPCYVWYFSFYTKDERSNVLTNDGKNIGNLPQTKLKLKYDVLLSGAMEKINLS